MISHTECREPDSVSKIARRMEINERTWQEGRQQDKKLTAQLLTHQREEVDGYESSRGSFTSRRAGGLA
jgi:hypothetical protein